jgi:hypothetical protein
MNSRIVLLGVALASSAVFGAGDKKTQQLFVKQCAGCHSVPDPAIRTDMAWLDQVSRTS